MYASLHTAMFGIAIISTAATATAVQLASFTPRLEISNTQCRAAYTTTIDGCVPTDFVLGATCSAACVEGLKKIGEVIKRVCRDVDVGETSIIGVFQNDLGVRALCPRAAAPSASSSKLPELSSAQPPFKTSSAAAPPSSTLVTSSSSSTSTSTSESETAQSSSSSSGLVVDPNPTSIAAGSPTEVAPPPASSTPAPAPPPNAQLSNADSGGGSPFDVVATSAASSQMRVVDLAMAAFIGTAFLFVGCA